MYGGFEGSGLHHKDRAAKNAEAVYVPKGPRTQIIGLQGPITITPLVFVP